MTKNQKKSKTAETLIYIGPTIPGIAKQFTFYRNGIPQSLAEKKKEIPMIGELLIHPDALPTALRELNGKSGRTYKLLLSVLEKL